MRLFNVTGNQSALTVKKPCQKLLFKLTFNNTGTSPTDNNTGILRQLTFTGALSHIVTVYRQNSSGQRSIAKLIPLYHLMEIAHGKEGFIRQNSNPQLTNGPVTIEGYIDLSHTGTIALDDSDYLQIDISGANAADGIEIFTKTTEDSATTMLRYDYLKTGAGATPTTINSAGYEYLFLTKDNLDHAALTYGNGLTDEMTPTELNADNDEMQTVIRLIDSGSDQNVVYGSDKLWQVPLVNMTGGKVVNRTELNTTGNTAYPYILMKSVNLKDAQG